MGGTMTILSWSRVKKSWKIAFFSALIIGLIAHTYKFVNTLPNHDALFFTYSRQNTIGSGRWFLTLACGLSGYFDLPWINGLLSLTWIGLTAVIIADLFALSSPVILILEGGLLATFPCVTNTFFFEFAADGYMLAMLLAALAVRLSQIGEKRVGFSVLAALCLCFSCGIYQAYVSFALLLSVCYFAWELLRDRYSMKEYLRWIGKQVLIYGCGMLAYWIVWKLCLHFQNAAASGYQGISTLGQISAASLLHAVRETGVVLARFFFGGNVMKYGWTGYAVMNLVFLLLAALVLICAVIKQGVQKKPGHLLLVLLCLLAVPVFACVWMYLSPDVGYHMLMLQSLCVLYLFVLFLSGRYFSKSLRTFSVLFFLVLVFRFALQANDSYFKMEQCREHSRAEAIEMLTRIHMQDDGSVKRIAFLGGGDQSLVSVGDKTVQEFLVNAHQLRPTLLFDHLYASLYLRNVMGASYEPVSEEELLLLQESEETQGMTAWPARDSLRIIGDTAVIRLADPLQEEAG